MGAILLLIPTRALRSDNFVFYLPNAHHIIPLEVIEHVKYLSLLQTLNVVGKVSGLEEKKNTLKVWFGNAPLELRADDKRVRVGKGWVELTDPIRVSNGQWMVPVDFLTSALPRLIHEVVEYQVGTNRIFVGNVRPSSFTVRLDQVANGARLTVQFTDKVSVRTAAQNGQWVMFLGDRPMEPLEQTYHFQNPYVGELRFDDQDGVSKLILTPSAGGLNFYPVLAEGGKVLLADVVKPPSALAEQPRPSADLTATTSTPPSPAEEVPATQPGPPLPVVVLDPGHGAEDAGARSRDGVMEKDLVAQVVARVRLALLSTKKYRIVLTRVGDTNPGFEQRELAANVARPVAFLTFHAGNLGMSVPRVAIYTYRAPSPSARAVEDEAKKLFIPWSSIQQLHLDRSRQLAQALSQQFQQIPGVTALGPAEAPVRALRSVGAPAVAIEIGSLSQDADSGPLTGPSFQQAISAGIAKALEEFQGRQS